MTGQPEDDNPYHVPSRENRWPPAPPHPRPDQSIRPEMSRRAKNAGIIALVIAVVMGIGLVGIFAMLAVGLNNWGSNK